MTNTNTEAVEAALESSLCAPSWAVSLQHVHEAIEALSTAKIEPSAAGLVEELQAHVEAADKQVETGQFGQECIAFGEWTWKNRHRILTALSAPTRERELVAQISRLTHTGDEGFASWEDAGDDAVDTLDGLIAQAREIRSTPLLNEGSGHE